MGDSAKKTTPLFSKKKNKHLCFDLFEKMSIVLIVFCMFDEDEN